MKNRPSRYLEMWHDAGLLREEIGRELRRSLIMGGLSLLASTRVQRLVRRLAQLLGRTAGDVEAQGWADARCLVDQEA